MVAITVVFGSPLSGQSGATAFTNVAVIPMDTDRILERHTVVVNEDRIVALGPVGEVSIPEGAVIVDGRDKYLMPGLTDMHTHPGRADFGLLIANGVTGARVMRGTRRSLRWRDSIAAGHLVGPSLFVAGAIIEGTPPPEFAQVIDTVGRAMADTRDRGRYHVRRQQADGVDFIKVYNNVPRDAYAGVVEEARRLGLTVAGHVPFDVGLRGVIDAGQTSIEHLRGYVWELVPSQAPNQPGRDLRSRSLAWRDADRARFADVVAVTARAGIWNVPTLSVGHLYLAPQPDVDRRLTGPEGAFMSNATRAMLRDRGRIPWLSNFSERDFELAAEGLETQKALVKALHDGGAKLLAGTDVSPWGFSLHWELELLVETGLTPYDALVAATRHPAEFLGWDRGTIAIGRRADLVMLRANPLDEIGNTRSIDGVMAGGQWLPRGTLDSLLAAAR